MAMADQTGDAPIKNWTLGKWDGFAKVNGIAMAKTILKSTNRSVLHVPFAVLAM